MKSRFLLPFFLASFAQAQVYTPPPELPAAQPATPTDTAPPAEKKSNPGGQLGQEMPMLDPSAETISIGGMTIPIGDTRVLRARFEKYLNQPAESDDAAKKYRSTIKQILASLSPLKAGGADMMAGIKQLPIASDYPGDADLCSTLLESLATVMRAKNDVKGLANINAALDSERRRNIANGDWIAKHPDKTSMTETKKANGDTSKKEEAGPGTGNTSLAYADVLRRGLEIEVTKQANVLKSEGQTIRAKVQYQASMVQWFAQRRYEHVLMASRFYNLIWKDGDTTLHMDEKSDASKLFSQSIGFSPTVASLDSFSNEAIRETTKYIEAFDLMLERGELHTASQRLMEAFVLGEFLAPVATLSLEKKRQISGYFRDLNELYGSLNAHDYTKTIDLAARLKTQAKDFPSSKVDSAIAGYTLASDLAIEEAKSMLLAKESTKAAAKIQTAAEIWPTNPKLKEFRTLVNNSSSLVMARNDFDRLLGEGNFREIARRQYEIAPTIQGDPKREEAFKEIIKNLTKIETALGKASEFSKIGQNYAAWEQLAKLRQDFPDDPKLGRELELLAPKVADFTKALDKAKQFETNEQIGSALSWYLKARSIHPQSDLADAGARRLANSILPPDESASSSVPPEVKDRNR
jgi:hypothetical protein